MLQDSKRSGGPRPSFGLSNCNCPFLRQFPPFGHLEQALSAWMRRTSSVKFARFQPRYP